MFIAKVRLLLHPINGLHSKLVDQGLPAKPSVPMHLRLLSSSSCGLQLGFPKLLNDAMLLLTWQKDQRLCLLSYQPVVQGPRYVLYLMGHADKCK